MTTMLFSLRGPLRLILGNLYVLFFLLLLLEAGSKALGLHYPAISRPGRDGVRGLWIYDATLGWFHAPHATASTPAPGSETVEIRINSLAARKKSYPVAINSEDSFDDDVKLHRMSMKKKKKSRQETLWIPHDLGCVESWSSFL